MNDVLEIIKSDNRYRLHQANHIIDVEVCQDPDTTYRFININHYRPPEGGRLYDMKVVSGNAFLRTYFV